MKLKLLSFLAIFICLNQEIISCPIWQIGRMYIVNENMKPLLNAIVWRYSSPNDSFNIKRQINQYDDASAFYFWSSRSLEKTALKSKSADKFMRIQVKGYADVVISELEFIDSDDDDEILPALYVKMFTNKIIKRGDLYTLFTQYKCEKKIMIKDSLTLDLKIYTEFLNNASKVGEASRVSAFVIKTYPNPVKDKLNVEINIGVTKPYSARVLDLQGRLISETSLISQWNILDMEWQVAGTYFIQVYDPDGVLLYAFKFMKI